MIPVVVILALFSWWAFRTGRDALAILLLGIAAFALRFWVAGLDQFLHDWDERYHALVAKNMMDNPLRPMLRKEPVIPYDYQAWCCNHIWLHKQPLFLWQMAASMKLFGANLMAMRFPSVMLSAVLVWPVFRIASLSLGRDTGYLTALFWTFAYYNIEQAAGVISMEHNDVAFTAYVTLSIWCFMEYMHSGGKNRWWILAGLFAGSAILVKWLTGLLVYAAWGPYALSARWKYGRQAPLWDMLKALALTTLVVMPWQLYIHHHFPLESRWEMAYNSRHVTEVIENHGGSVLFYLEKLDFQYGRGAWLLLGLGWLLCLPRIFQEKKAGWPAWLILVPLLFFSAIAQTKLPSYTYFIAPLVLIGMAKLAEVSYAHFREAGLLVPWLGLLIPAFFCAFLLRYAEIRDYHLERKNTPYLQAPDVGAKLHNRAVYEKLDSLVPAGTAVFNGKMFEDTEAMFYSDRNVYQWWMSEMELADLKRKGIPIAVFQDHTNQRLPEFLRRDSSIQVITETLR